MYGWYPFAGKTRTKDKYRVVYTDHQRLELEKEFHFSRYITIRRKAEIAQQLQLSERQVRARDGVCVCVRACVRACVCVGGKMCVCVCVCKVCVMSLIHISEPTRPP